MKPVDDRHELKQLVNLLWQTTLVLNDGTRLKTIAIDWKRLTSEQRSIVIAEVRRLAIRELKSQRARAKVHLEFSSIPKELRQMLVDLAGEDNPDFSWSVMGKDDP
jgi:hypothetical protein